MENKKQLAARARRGVGAPILAKPLGRGFQPGGRNAYSGPIPRSTCDYHYWSAVYARLDPKYVQHDVVNPETGEVHNAVVRAHFRRFLRQVKRNAWRATLALRRQARSKR